MERIATPAEKKKLRAYFGQFNLLSRIALMILVPVWVSLAAWVAFDLTSLPSLADALKSGFSDGAAHRIEFVLVLTIVIIIAFRENRSESWQVGRVREATGLLTRASEEDGNGFRFNGEPLWIPHTMEIDCARFNGQQVLVERVEILRTQRGQGKSIEHLVVSIRLNSATN